MREDSISIYNGRGVATDCTVKRSDIEAVVRETYRQERQREWEEFKGGCGTTLPMPGTHRPREAKVPIDRESPFREAVRELVSAEDYLFICLEYHQLAKHDLAHVPRSSVIGARRQRDDALAKVRALLGDEG